MNKNYFSPLFQMVDKISADKNDKFIIKNLIKRRKLQTKLNKYLFCSAEEMILTNKVNTLQNICLIFLHKELCNKTCIYKDLFVLDYLKTPYVITRLCIPTCFKKILVQMYYNCARHCLLFTYINPPKTNISRYMLKNATKLYIFLNNSSFWEKNNNSKLWNLAELITEILKLPDFLIGTPPFTYVNPIAVDNISNEHLSTIILNYCIEVIYEY